LHEEENKLNLAWFPFNKKDSYMLSFLLGIIKLFADISYCLLRMILRLISYRIDTTHYYDMGM